MRPENRNITEPLILLALCLLALVISGIGPHDRATWWMEVAPVLIGVPLLIFTWNRFRPTTLLYRLIFVHALILIIGGHYTYARVPAGFWIQELFDLGRNHYDRLGHLAQGFIPAILVRELLRKQVPVLRGGWLFLLVTCACLAFSAFYEMIEWWAALAGGEAAESFLGTQGDIWDTQWDMFLALLGALLSLILFSGRHEKQLTRQSREEAGQ